MSLVQILIVVLVAAVVAVVVRRLKARERAQRTFRERASRQLGARPTVRCAYCGVHLPEEEALAAQGRFYCCDAHRAQREPDEAR